MSGIRRRAAFSWIRMIFWTVFSPQEPAFTVKSLAITQIGRPTTVPTPVTTPSAGVSGSAERARSQSSWNSVPGSRRRPRRSRTKSLPSARSLSRYLTFPCRTRAISLRSRGSLTPGMVARRSGVARRARLFFAGSDRDDQNARLMRQATDQRRAAGRDVHDRRQLAHRPALDAHQDANDRVADAERLDLHLAPTGEREALEHS